MDTRRYYLADVFTAQAFSGNPLAVVADAEGLSDDQMQRIAREFNLSETTFVSATDAPDQFRVRIFAPAEELPFAGHPTLGTAFVLASCGRIPLSEGDNFVTLLEGVGPISVRIEVRNGKPVFCQFVAAGKPEFGEPLSSEALASILGLFPEDVLDGRQGPDAVSCGVPFHIAPLGRMAALSRIQFDTAAYNLWGAKSWARSFCAVARDPAVPTRLHVRVFSPAFGFLEDPATGAAAAALAAWLGDREAGPDGCFKWEIWQGFDMGRPSQLQIEAERQGGRTTAVRVGGTAVVIGDGQLYLPSR